MILILLGPPGVGKGTQAKILASKLDLRHVSTGDMLREAAAKGTELGLQVKAIMDAGNLVSDDIMLGLIGEVLQDRTSHNGIILDGFPRTIPQAEGLDTLFTRLRLQIDAVISLELNEEENINRLSNRVTCRQCGNIYNRTKDNLNEGSRCPTCGGELYIREDDKRETVKQRLDVYRKNTAPLKEFYKNKGILKTIDASGSVESITQSILAIVGR
jgi:adenylate kinase